jgi:hypothetical protein
MTVTIGASGPGHLEVLKNETQSLEVGEEHSLTVQVPEVARAFKVTLIWTDLPGEVLQNDLDLIVRVVGGEERHGNAAPGSDAFDRANNVEQVQWENVPSGNVELIVRAFRILQPQSYALVARTV